MNILNIVKKLFPFEYSIVGKGNDKSIKTFKKFLPFKISSYKSDNTINGWKVPKEFKVIKADLIYKSNRIYNGKSTPFGVPVHSKSYQGKIDYNKLKNHIFFSNTLTNAIPYNWTGLYRKQEPKWGFCMSKKKFLKLKKGTYQVNLKTESKKSFMRVMDYTLKGKSKETIIINAHNCHPFQANDDISGCAVGISIIQSLKKIKNRYFTYKLLIAPELTGTVFWLNKNYTDIKYAILLKSVGNKNKIKLQKSYKGNTKLDIASINLIKKNFKKYKIGNFREIYGNDETVFDSPGFNIPTISLTRYPFKEYHTNLDVPSILSEKKLKEVKEYVLKIIHSLEKDQKELFKINFKGLISLSNPKYNLYLSAKSPGVDKTKYNNEKKKWNLLMNCLPNDIDSELSLNEISKKYKLPLKKVKIYCNKWLKKKLISKRN